MKITSFAILSVALAVKLNSEVNNLAENNRYDQMLEDLYETQIEP